MNQRTKQEEIREGIREGIESVIKQFEEDSPDAGYGYEAKEMAKAILAHLHSKGVGIDNGNQWDDVQGHYYRELEPLIGEDNAD
jgi:hypothetical protein